MHGPSDLVKYGWEFYVWSKPLGVVEDGGIGDKLLLLGERSVRRPTGTEVWSSRHLCEHTKPPEPVA
jgi:hypothetical protein